MNNLIAKLNHPKGWILQLVIFEIFLAFLLGFIMGLLNIQAGSSISFVAVYAASLGFCMNQENKRLQGHLPGWTQETRSSVAVWTSIWMTVVGFASLLFFYLAGASEFQDLPMYILVLIMMISFLVTWGAHVLSFKQATKMSQKAFEKQNNK